MEVLGVPRWRAILAPWRVEAFELLETLAIVERVSWSDMLRTLASTDDAWGCSPMPQPCKKSLLEAVGRFLIGPQPGSDKRSNNVEVATIYFAFDKSTMSPAFSSARQAIYAALMPEAQLRLAQQEPIPLAFKFTMRQAPLGAPAASYLRAIGDFARLLVKRASRAKAAEPRRESCAPWQYRVPFKLQHVKLMDINECAPHEHGVAAALAELLALGVQLNDNIDTGNQSWFMSRPIPELGPVLLGIVDPGSLRASLGIEQIASELPVKRLFLTDFRFDSATVNERAYTRQLGAVFSALLSARAPTKLRLYANNCNRSRQSAALFVRWLALALFSKDSTSSVSSLDIDASKLTPADAVGIAQVLGAKNPSRALLLDSADARAPTTRPSALASSAAGEDLTASALEAQAQSDTNAPAVVEIVNNDDDDDHDLGFAVVKAGTQVRVKPLDGSNGQATDSFVLQQGGRFRVMRDDDNGGWVDIVVPCYGHCVVTRGSIDHFDIPVTSESSLLAGYHGSLTKIKLSSDSSHSGLLSLVRFVAEGAGEELIEAYERRQCKIESLSIDGFWGVDGSSSIAFVRELRDSAMLASNHTLQYLSLCAMDEIFCPRETALMETDGQWLLSRSLPAPQRYAFLSVLWADEHYARNKYGGMLVKFGLLRVEKRFLDDGAVKHVLQALVVLLHAAGWIHYDIRWSNVMFTQLQHSTAVDIWGVGYLIRESFGY
ncbi:hypothetical protein PybrP1_011951 [[Pythium] brassicae (nom. inval.)]|nr:hypothetical protein PybrP1_011951 [[Pythium] brassicae (nom. inval.)]